MFWMDMGRKDDIISDNYNNGKIYEMTNQNSGGIEENLNLQGRHWLLWKRKKKKKLSREITCLVLVTCSKWRTGEAVVLEAVWVMVRKKYFLLLTLNIKSIIYFIIIFILWFKSCRIKNIVYFYRFVIHEFYCVLLLP